LAILAGPLGIRVHVVPALTVGGVVVSSSSLREALRQGEVERVAGLLGRPYALGGRVTRGAMRGRTLGFPTANLLLEHPLPLATGVYAARAEWDGGSGQAVVNIGVRPTFGESTPVVEAHLLDVKVDLYDRPLALAFVARIRDEMRFASVDPLPAPIPADLAAPPPPLPHLPVP